MNPQCVWCVAHSGSRCVLSAAFWSVLSFSPSCLLLLSCVCFSFWHGDASGRQIHLIHNVLYNLTTLSLNMQHTHVRWGLSVVQINFTWHIHNVLIIDLCSFVAGLPSAVLILWVLTRFFYDDRGYDTWYAAKQLIFSHHFTALTTLYHCMLNSEQCLYFNLSVTGF